MCFRTLSRNWKHIKEWIQGKKEKVADSGPFTRMMAKTNTNKTDSETTSPNLPKKRQTQLARNSALTLPLYLIKRQSVHGPRIPNQGTFGYDEFQKGRVKVKSDKIETIEPDLHVKIPMYSTRNHINLGVDTTLIDLNANPILDVDLTLSIAQASPK
jgi:hypothetical protein